MKKFELYAFCLNYDHFHLLIKPNKKNYSQIMHFLKRHTSRNINIILGYNKFDLRKIMYPDDEGEVGEPRLRQPRLRQYRQQYTKKYGENFFYPKFKWQKSFYDHIIRNENDFKNHWNYTMFNYLKHNLPEKWKYTGLNYPELIDDVDDGDNITTFGGKLWKYI